jgi:dolichol-phosphate mannosyltransferase
MKVFICLPAYNEEFALLNLLRRIHENLDEFGLAHKVILIDDGSTDRTVKIAEGAKRYLDIDIIQHRVNRGLGEAIMTGLRYALEFADARDAIVTMDADNTHTPGLILRMVRSITEGNDVVIASRYVPGANVKGVSFSRRLLSYGASVLCRILFPTRNLRDYTSGYRAYRASVIGQAFSQFGEGLIREAGFTCMLEILLKLRAMDAIISEVPLVLRYDMRGGASKMKVFETVKTTTALVFRRRFGI